MAGRRGNLLLGKGICNIQPVWLSVKYTRVIRMRVVLFCKVGSMTIFFYIVLGHTLSCVSLKEKGEESTLVTTVPA